MHIETLLPLGKLDPGLREPDQPLDIAAVAEDARRVEQLGYDGLVVEDTKDDPFLVMALAAQATERLQLATSVAIAFPRSPTVTAMSAWTLQKLSRGRFTLGLGTQVRAHIQRRFGMRDWSPAGPWMREYVQAVRSLWDAWQNGTPLNFEGERYQLNLLVPLFTPAPIAHPAIPIHLAAVNRYMCRVAGEVGDGLRPHPICTPTYIREVMLPAMRDGAERAGRDADAIAVCMKPLVGTATDEAALQERIAIVRARVAFYASTPGYRKVFEHHGLGDLARELSVLSREQRWEEMPSRISDEVMHTFAVIGTHDRIAGLLAERYGDIASRVEFSIPATTPQELETLGELVRALQAV
ncbi:MAG: TIGR03617 family F420-dependent LLM class oxidoreductase [SAR324 cluster bacterium]|nr:TIGR03617 family F420-dependent LLM class oxidoreductase [SAR324 cluster bacterium]